MFRLHTLETKNAHPTDFSLNDIEGTTNKGSTATVLRLPRSLLSLKDIRTLCKSKPFQKQTGHLLRYELYQNWCPVMVRERRLELPRLLPHAPQTCLSTYSSTLASANNIIAIDLLFVNRKFRTAAAAEKSHICRILRICARSRAARLKLHGRAAGERTRLLLRCLA